MSRLTATERVAVESRRVEKVYAFLAKGYDDFFDWALGPGRRHAVRSLPLSAGDRILEVGVGTGLSLPHYAPDCHVTGIDISEPMLEQARERASEMDGPRTELRLMDAHELAYDEGSFDHVLAPYVISVVPEPHKVMAEIRRVCKPGGTIVVVNHFLSDSRLLSLVERGLTPLSQWIGFRMDLPLEVVLQTEGLEVEVIEKVNLFGLWRMIVFRRH